MAIDTHLMSLADFMQKYSDDGPFEILNGEIIPMSPQASGSSRKAGKFFRRLADYVEANDLGEAFIETPFVLALDNGKWVKGSRVPDVMFILKDRIEKFMADNPDHESKPITMVPDFVVEIISPSDRFSDVHSKALKYLEDGVKLVWVVDPKSKTVLIYSAGSNQQQTHEWDTVLSADPVISGFEVVLSELFS